MSVEIKNLTKIYGTQRAVDNISFHATKGEIMGFLGPNGAGKSTTMKIATGYLPPTLGTVTVCGLDVQQQTLDVKKKIGYLPEHNPLYLDMYVHEYLTFMGHAYGIRGSSLQKTKTEVIARCGLGREQNKLIGALSKGYRQRVGLAQALISNPEVLILDEPTTGLDPNQIVEIRNVIKTISKEKTVIFSTHIMQEAQALCNHVVIINKGKVVKNDTMAALQSSLVTSQNILLEFSEKTELGRIAEVSGIKNVVKEPDTFSYRIEAEEGLDLRNEILKIASEDNLPLVGIRQLESSLEELFQQLTQS